MELKDFVTQVLAQIIDGVKEAQNICNNGGFINPLRKDKNPTCWMMDDGGVCISTGNVSRHVEFDVAVTVTEGNSKQGGIGVSVANLINVGNNKKSESQHSTESRIKFSVPIMLPGQVLPDLTTERDYTKQHSETALL